MKVLLISDNQNDLTVIDDFLKKHGFDTIIYHWLLKALDNIEEISPDLTIVSAYDYPRHWKTLVQFENAVGKNKSDVILYAPENLSVTEKNKARALGVKGIFYSTAQKELDNLMAYIDGEKEFEDFDSESEDAAVTEKDSVPTVDSITEHSSDENAENEEKPKFNSLLARIQAMKV